MNKITLILLSIFTLLITSCNNKKMTEVVEVPLPSTLKEKVPVSNPDDVKAEKGAFAMLKLPYFYDALEPSIDAKTMEVHYSKHYLSYTNKLNKAVFGTSTESLPIEEILKKIDLNNLELRNNAGGYYNHTLFWESMTPKKDEQLNAILSDAISRDFGSFDLFKTKFKETASKQFGSGWTWLIIDKTGKLQIINSQNQDNPLMPNAAIKGTPILALDLWEHAYYLGYQYKRKNYINAFFDVINWKKVGERYEEALK